MVKAINRRGAWHGLREMTTELDARQVKYSEKNMRGAMPHTMKHAEDRAGTCATGKVTSTAYADNWYGMNYVAKRETR